MTNRTGRVCSAAALVLALAAIGESHLVAQGPAGGRGAAAPPRAAQQSAPQNLTLEGYWVAIVNEDWRWRMVTPPRGDFASLAVLNDEGRRVANTWTPAQDGSCLAYGMANLMRMPTRLHITWENPQTLRIETDAGQQTRRLYFDRSQAPTARSLQGRSIAQWEAPAGGRGGGGRGGAQAGPPPPPQFGTLRVATDNLSGGWLRRNGVPYSDRATVQEYFDNFDSPYDKAKWLSITTIVTDPVYLNGDFVTSSHFRREAGPEGPRPQNWAPAPCKG